MDKDSQLIAVALATAYMQKEEQVAELKALMQFKPTAANVPQKERSITAHKLISASEPEEFVRKINTEASNGWTVVSAYYNNQTHYALLKKESTLV